MKRLFLTLACLMLMAAFAFTANAQTAPDPADLPDEGVVPIETDWHRGHGHHPVQPVPEPGTMALASMGLIALGAAARRRRGK